MYRYKRRYTGPVQAVIMDLAGTCVDFGSLAPIQAFQALFAEEGVPISITEARAPMGKEKREHIEALLAMPRIAQEWLAVKGTKATDEDIDRLYHAFVVHQVAAIADNHQLISGIDLVMEYCDDMGILIGVNTGYSREMIQGLLPAMAEQGFTPDSVVCASDVPAGRPYPWMCLTNAQALEVSCVQACVKVDDTAVGIEEGLNAGMWTVAVAVSGNQTGYSEAQWLALSEEERDVQAIVAHQALASSGAHYVIDSIAELPEVLDDITLRLANEERP
ncbi:MULTISPECIES: phosphonoacetaldehyde hydrolase [Nitrincola]|uniref:Phosphonoacetaldehyde hydrolase n=1 Tax=Nitrincola nitratireducens TaxID=1229521 RepID=W9UYI8_9GAMM|nr:MULTISPECIES: phosphonoacetaldehyde hydrolase [Nitrincola]EXJ09781.1 Phosphonoacetaldehyde hydrolase [Nitrincola nitratireducens]